MKVTLFEFRSGALTAVVDGDFLGVTDTNNKKNSDCLCHKECCVFCRVRLAIQSWTNFWNGEAEKAAASEMSTVDAEMEAIARQTEAERRTQRDADERASHEYSG